MSRHALAAIFWCIGLVLVNVSPAFGQATTGEITGRIEDAAGAVVPGATVTADNADTGFSRSTQSGAEGDYLITLLPPGRYTVSAELQGFKRAVRESVLISVGTRQTLLLRLEVGGVTEQVLVSGAAPLIDTTRSEISGVVTSRDIANLPALNRTFANLAMTMPEARPAGGFDPTKTRVGNFAMNGGDGRQLDVNVDGGDNKDNVVGSLLQNFAYESVQEFQVLQHRWSAEAGRAVGGVVNVISKSGTNELRGSGFGTFRNDSMVAKDFFQKRGVVKPPFERKEYGGSVGGPISRDRLFFFGAIERFDEPKSETPIRSQAIFNELRSVPGANPVDAIPTPYDDTLLTLKVDQRLNDRQNLSYRFSMQQNSSDNDQVANPATTDLSGGSTNTNDLYDFVAKHNFSLGGNRLNEFTFHFQDFTNEILGVTDDPILIFSTPRLRVGPAPNTPQPTTVRKFQFRDDFTLVQGQSRSEVRHQLHPHQAGRLLLLRRVRLRGAVLRRSRSHHRQPGALSAGLRDARCRPARELFHRRGFARSDVPSAGVLRSGRLAPGTKTDAEPRTALGREHRPAARPDQQPDDRTAAAARRSAGAGDHGRRGQARAHDAELEGISAAAWLRLRRHGRCVPRDPRRIRSVLRPAVPEPDALLDDAERARVLRRGHAAGEHQRRRRAAAEFPLRRGSAAAPPAVGFGALPAGTFGRINHPDSSDPYVHKTSIGFEKILRGAWVLSSDYVHTDGFDEGRVVVINPQIRPLCDPTFAGSRPSDARCVAGATTRYFDAAFVRAGLGAGRLSQINMIGTTNESRFDSLTTTLRGRAGNTTMSVSYVLSSSRAWGGQPTASYSGNGIAITPEQQFRDEEWGPTRHDERHRLVASGVIELPVGFQIAPIVQLSSSRPYTPTTGFDSNGDGQINIVDRLCAGVDPRGGVSGQRQRGRRSRAMNPNGCALADVNSQRSGFVVNPDGSIEERSGRFFNTDLRITKNFPINRRMLRVYVDFYNLFNTENLSFTLRPEESRATSAQRLHAAGVALRAWIRSSGGSAVHGFIGRTLRVLGRDTRPHWRR